MQLTNLKTRRPKHITFLCALYGSSMIGRYFNYRKKNRQPKPMLTVSVWPIQCYYRDRLLVNFFFHSYPRSPWYAHRMLNHKSENTLVTFIHAYDIVCVIQCVEFCVCVCVSVCINYTRGNTELLISLILLPLCVLWNMVSNATPNELLFSIEKPPWDPIILTST